MIGGLALAFALLNSPGEIVADNRFDALVAPGRRLRSSFDLWDRTRGFGDVREDVWPLTTIPAWLMGQLGLPYWITQRIWHAGCLTAAAVGTMAVLRRFRPDVDVANLVAGLLVVAGPFSLTFLVPSNLYLMFAAGPWLLLVFLRGVDEPGWRWPATFAVIVALCGNPDLPGLVYGMVAVLPAIWYVASFERTAGVRCIAVFWARTVALTVPASALVLAKTWLAGRRLADRLAATESPEVGALTSSWGESVRGLGNWLSYFRAQGGLVKPQGEVFLVVPVVVGATYVAAILSLVVLWRATWRPRLVLFAMALISLVLMVGGFGADGSPVARLILAALTEVDVLSPFRNTYKAAGGLVIGSSMLAGLAYAVGRRRTRRRVARTCVDLAAVALLMAVSVPAWTGSLYHPDRAVGAVPSYWLDAIEQIDDMPEPGRVLVIPAASQVPYRWGNVGDDIFDGLSTRPRAIATGVPAAGPLGADAVEALTMLAQDPAAPVDAFVSMARRLGVTEVVLRNDVDWQRARLARPSAFERLRADPGLALVSTHGSPGENVVAADDESAEARAERELHPVEIFSVVDGLGGAQLRDARSVVVLSGSASSWPSIIDTGSAAPDASFLQAGAATDDDLERFLDAGAPVVLTDTPRRRVRSLVAFEPRVSATLARDQDLERPAGQLYQRPDNEAVAWYRDAVRIEGTATRDVGATAFRPALAFDRDTATAWSVPRLGGPASARLAVHLRKPVAVNVVEIQSLLVGGRPTVTAGWVALGAGDIEPFTVGADGTASVTLGGAITDSVQIVARRFDPAAGRAGFTEVRIDDLDLREYVEAPDELLERSPFANRGTAFPVSYVFERVRMPTWFSTNGDPSTERYEERRFDRRFRVPFERSFEVVASIVVHDVEQRSVVAERFEDDCIDLGVRLILPGGEPESLLLRLRPQRSTDPVLHLEGCDTLELRPGWHLMEVGSEALIDRVAFIDRTTGSWDPNADVEIASAPTTSASASSVTVELPDDPVMLVLPTTHDDGWSLSLPDGSVSSSAPIDASNAWIVEGGREVATASFAGERTIDVAGVLSVVTVMSCLVLIGSGVARHRRRERASVEVEAEEDASAATSTDGQEPEELFAWFDAYEAARRGHLGEDSDDAERAETSADEDVPDAPTHSTPERWGSLALSVLIAVALVGAVGAAVAGLVWWLDRSSRFKYWVGLAPVALVSAAAAIMMLDLAANPVEPALGFPQSRVWTNQLVMIGFTFAAVILVLRSVDESGFEPDEDHEARQLNDAA